MAEVVPFSLTQALLSMLAVPSCGAGVWRPQSPNLLRCSICSRKNARVCSRSCLEVGLTAKTDFVVSLVGD